MKKIKKIFVTILVLTTILQNFAICVNAGELRKPFAENTIPGIIKAADLDSGPEGNAYLPSEPNYSVYRNDVEVGIYDEANGSIVSMVPGKWLRYTVTVKEDGYYDIFVTDASPLTDKELEISFLADPVTVSGPIPATESWEDLTTHKFGQKYLTAGVHTMQIKQINGGSSIYSVEFKKAVEIEKDIVESGVYRNHYLPTAIQAEEFDKGISGAYSVDNKNNGEKFREKDVIDIYENSKDGYYITLAKGEYTNYTFTVDNAGVYDFSALTNSGTVNADIYVDNYEYPIPVLMSTDINEILFSIYFPEGIHKVRVLSKTESATIDYISFLNSEATKYLKLSDLTKPVEPEEELFTESNKVYKELYVSLNGSDKADGDKNTPFATIKKAQEVARELSPKMDGNIIINIEPGYYKLDETILLNEKDSGQNGYNIIYKGASAEEETILGSGVKITGWEKTDNGIYKASVPDLSETRRLSINGQAATIAQSKYTYQIVDEFINPNSDYAIDGFYFEGYNFPSFEHPEDLELAFDILWCCQRIPVEKVEKVGDRVKVYAQQPALGISRTAQYQAVHPAVESVCSIENALELVDEYGEFYFDKREKVMYYYPYPQENMETAECYAGGELTELVKIEGSDKKNKISNVIFENLSFKHTSWNELTDSGYLSFQAEMRMQEYNSNSDFGEYDNAYNPPVAIRMNMANNIQVRDCLFEGIGTASIWAFEGVSNSKINANVIKDTAATGISIGHWSHRGVFLEGKELCKNIEVSNNVIHRVADDIRSGVGIVVYMAKGINIHHNDIKNVPYSGMSLGWVWNVHDIDAGDHIIAYNRIENVTQHLVDGGHIYTLGSLKNTKVHDNYFVGAADYRGGIYHDSGSSFMEIYRNVISNVNLWWHCYETTIHKDVDAHDNYVDTPNYQDDPDENCLAKDTYIVDGGRWPEEAQDIIAAAGLEENYKYLLDDAIYPEWRTETVYHIADDKFMTKNGAWIEAEDWNKGPEGVGFHKELGGSVTIQTQEKQEVIGVTYPGDWLKYDITIPKDGTYTLQMKTCDGWEATDPACMVDVYVDDELIVDNHILPRVDWDTFVLSDIGDYYMTAGVHTVKIEFVNKEWAFDAFRFFGEGQSGNDEDYDEGVIVEEIDDRFTDIDGHWAKRSINDMKKIGVVGGVGANQFKPDDNATLYQMIWMTGRYFGILDSDEHNWKEKAVEVGFLTSINEQDCVLTKERMTDIVAKGYLHFYSLNEYTPRREIEYADFDKIKAEYQLSARIIRDWWLITPDENGNFNPENTVTRAEAVNILSRYDDVKSNYQLPAIW